MASFTIHQDGFVIMIGLGGSQATSKLLVSMDMDKGLFATSLPPTSDAIGPRQHTRPDHMSCNCASNLHGRHS